jgi:hypothetical protein
MASNKINGWLRQRMRADGMTWLWCYQRLRPGLDGKRPLWGQTMNAKFVKPAAIALGLVAKTSVLVGTVSATV